MATALLFPGQGSQKVGMATELTKEFEVARRVFQEADDALGFSIARICAEGPDAALTATENTQPAILTTSIAVLRVLESERGLNVSVYGVAAGHSLGEWTALVAVGALRFADAVKLVNLRGKAMQDAVPAGQGAMAAIMGMEPEALEAVCREASGDEVVQPANFNGAGQIVISGHAGAVQRAMALAKERGAKRAAQLPVSAPFHCPLMKPAAERVAQALESIHVKQLAVPVVANVDATPNRDPARVKQLLVQQVTGAVRWEQCVQRLAADGVTRALEIGPGTVLRGLVKRIASTIEIDSVGEPKDVREVKF